MLFPKKTDSNTDLDSTLLENLELVSNFLASADNGIRIAIHSYYAVLKLKRFQRWGQIEELEEAIEKARWAVERMAGEHEDFAGMLKNFGVMLETRHTRTEKTEDLGEAIRVARQAVDVTPENHPDLADLILPKSI